MRRTFFTVVSLVLLAGSTACDSGGPDRVISIETKGVAVGIAYVDRNGDGKPQVTDGFSQGVRVSLVVPDGQAEVAQATTDATGAYVMKDVPVGRYRVIVDTTTLGDTLRVSKIDSATVTISANDTARTTITLGYPQATMAQVRRLTLGRKVQVTGVALNGWSAFGDSTMSVADSSGALRMVRVRPSAVVTGDSVRLLGTVSIRDGQPVLTGVEVTVLATGLPAPVPADLTTAAAASGEGGQGDATLAHIQGATIISIQVNPDGERVASVDDGSGPLKVSIAPRSPITLQSAFVAGATLEASGILVPSSGAAGWVMRPRESRDLNPSFRSVTVAQARLQPIGRTVQVDGIALNGWTAFGDATVHVADATGALRMVSVRQASVFTGDSVRMVGTVSMRDGQVVLANVTPLVLATARTDPQPAPTTTATAARADGGRLDAALVHVASAVVQDTSRDTTTGDFHARVDDGSGPLDVVIDQNLGLALGIYVVGATLDVTGLLVPASGGASWVLKPREARDLVLK